MEFPLSPRAKRNGNGYIDHCPAHKDNKPSLSINFAQDGKLLLHCFAGCSFEEILRASGLSHNQYTDFRWHKVTPNPIDTPHKRTERARVIWQQTVPLKGTLGEKYYLSRQLNIWSEDIRFHEALYEADAKHEFPAVVCAVRLLGKFVGIHRTFLNSDGSKNCKKMLGPCRGASVYVGGSGEKLVICEGIENTLSALRMFGWRRATFFSALSANGMKNLKLPEKPGTVIILSDGDKVGQASAVSLGERAAVLRWRASTMYPPSKGDWNDYLISELGNA